ERPAARGDHLSPRRRPPATGGLTAGGRLEPTPWGIALLDDEDGGTRVVRLVRLVHLVLLVGRHVYRVGSLPRPPGVGDRGRSSGSDCRCAVVPGQGAVRDA